jgi:hypothetical protein
MYRKINMYYEIRTCIIHDTKIKECPERFEKPGLPVISHHAKRISWWYTETGELSHAAPPQIDRD